MELKNLLAHELTQEYNITKKFLENYPEGQNDYAPHEKSTKLQPLTDHIVDIFNWPALMMNTDYLDFAEGGEQPPAPEDKAGFLKKLDDSYQKGLQALEGASDDQMDQRWQLRMGGKVLADWSKYESLRHALSQITHHRAQLGTYYRMQNIPVPGSYGPSADDQSF